MLKQTFDLSMNLGEKKIFETNFNLQFDYASLNQVELVKYLGDLVEHNLDDYHDAIEVWNNQFI